MFADCRAGHQLCSGGTVSGQTAASEKDILVNLTRFAICATGPAAMKRTQSLMAEPLPCLSSCWPAQVNYTCASTGTTLGLVVKVNTYESNINVRQRRLGCPELKGCCHTTSSGGALRLGL